MGVSTYILVQNKVYVSVSDLSITVLFSSLVDVFGSFVTWYSSLPFSLSFFPIFPLSSLHLGKIKLKQQTGEGIQLSSLAFLVGCSQSQPISAALLTSTKNLGLFHCSSRGSRASTTRQNAAQESTHSQRKKQMETTAKKINILYRPRMNR